MNLIELCFFILNIGCHASALNLLSNSTVNEGEPLTVACTLSVMNTSSEKRCVSFMFLRRLETSGGSRMVASYHNLFNGKSSKDIYPPYDKRWNISMEKIESTDCNNNGQAIISVNMLTSIEDSGVYICHIRGRGFEFETQEYLFVRRSSARKGASSFGTRFYLAFPESHSEVNCSLYTKEFESFNVTLTVAYYLEEVKPVTYRLKNSESTSAVLKLPFSSQSVYTIRFAYILEAQFEFQVMCYSLSTDKVPDSVMIAVPVKGFGRIYVVPSIPFQTSVEIISGGEDLAVTVEISYTTTDGRQWRDFLAQKESMGVIYLSRGSKSLSVDLCKYEDRNATVTGGLIKGSTNFGVIIGSCFLGPRPKTTEECPPDFGIDMLLPVTEYFKFFIVALPKNIAANVVLSFTGVTEVKVNDERKENSKSWEISRDLGVYKGILFITVSRASYVSVVLHSPCPADQNRQWKVMFNSILPRSLFIDAYFWETAFSKSHEQYVLVTYKIPNQFNIFLDGVSIYRTLGYVRYQEIVRQRNYFSSVEIESTPGRHQLYSVNAHKFGAYLFGVEIQQQTQLFMTPLGFAAQPGVRWGKFDVETTEEERCDAESREKELSSSEGDFIDNDCDFLVDEEMKDGIDNDGDGKIDEDTTLPFVRNGEWTQWESWQCSSINDKLKHRSRSCTNPAPTSGGYECDGLSTQSKPGNCQHIFKGIVDGELNNVAVECLCDETLGNLSMAKLKRDCIPPPSSDGELCKGDKDIVAPEDTCPKSCFKKEICRFERNSTLATWLNSEYTRTNIKAGLEGCMKACKYQSDCQGFTISTKNPDKPECWLFHRLIFGKEDESYESYIQKCNMVCESGYYSPEYNMKEYTTCRKCPTGTYKNLTSPGPCLDCPANWATPRMGSITVTDCSIVYCSSGFYLNSNKFCQPCELGTYKHVKGNQACLPCPINRITDTVGSTENTSCNVVFCSPGYYLSRNISMNATCQPCELGTYKHVKGNEACLPCPANKTTVHVGATNITSCHIPLNQISTKQTRNTSTITSFTTSPLTSPTVDTRLTLVFTTFVTMTQKKHYPGNWGGWTKWSCVENCTVKALMRTRPCLDPPQGPRDLDCPGFAYQLDSNTACNTICSTSCPSGHWGFNCSKKCPNCEIGCDKETGTCSRCKPGFRYPIKSCSEVCGEMTYGYDCTGDCSKKCQGKDCIERVQGTCLPKSIWKSDWWYALLVLLIIPIIVIAKISGQAARRQYEMTEANNLFHLVVEEEAKNDVPTVKGDSDIPVANIDPSLGTGV